MDPFIAEIRAVAFSFAPRGWIVCDGRLLPLSQYSTLYSLLGTNFGGNGQSTFAIPNLQGSALVSQGTGPGLTPYDVGELAGITTVTLTMQEMPAHTHAPDAKIDTTGNANMHSTPQNGDQLSRFSPSTGVGSAFNNPPLANPVTMNPQMIQAAGGGLPHNNMQPYLSLLYCIAAEGIYPSRN